VTDDAVRGQIGEETFSGVAPLHAPTPAGGVRGRGRWDAPGHCIDHTGYVGTSGGGNTNDHATAAAALRQDNLLAARILQTGARRWQAER